MCEALRGAGKVVRIVRPGQATAQCPLPEQHAHGDRNPSLGLHRRHGRVKVTCFTGCSDEDVLAALGLGVADLFDNRRTVEYHYRDRIVTRTPEKEFFQRPVNGAPLNASKTELYRVEEVIHANRRAKRSISWKARTTLRRCELRELSRLPPQWVPATSTSATCPRCTAQQRCLLASTKIRPGTRGRLFSGSYSQAT